MHEEYKSLFTFLAKPKHIFSQIISSFNMKRALGGTARKRSEPRGTKNVKEDNVYRLSRNIINRIGVYLFIKSSLARVAQSVLNTNPNPNPENR